MFYNAQKKNLIFISFAIFCAITISIFSYFYFISDYKHIEIELNNKNNLHFIDILDKDINTIQNITKDYANWDDTYTYVDGENDNYINNNFRENSSALEDLELDFLLIQDTNNKLLFSLKTKENKDLDLNELSEFINLKFDKMKNIATVVEYNNTLYIIIKEEINNSDSTKTPNGYFYFSRKITSEFLSEFNAFIFNVINLKDSNLKNKQMLLLRSIKFKKVINSYEFRDKYIYNELHFFSNNTYSFSIETKNSYQILLKAKKKVLIFNIIIILMLLLVFFLIYKYQKFLNINKKQLEKLVTFKTMQISKTLNELEDLNTKLYKLAHTDHLTQINNRRNFFLLSEDVFFHANNNRSDLAIIMIDIDNFKNINDKYGHDVGDKVLKMFVDALKENLEEEHIFGRLGGEEFAVTLPFNHLEAACFKAEILRSSVEKVSLISNSEILKVTASFGVATNEGCKSIDEILQKADKLLYAAKTTGKNKVRSRLN